MTHKSSHSFCIYTHHTCHGKCTKHTRTHKHMNKNVQWIGQIHAHLISSSFWLDFYGQCYVIWNFYLNKILIIWLIVSTAATIKNAHTHSTGIWFRMVDLCLFEWQTAIMKASQWRSPFNHVCIQKATKWHILHFRQLVSTHIQIESNHIEPPSNDH